MKNNRIVIGYKSKLGYFQDIIITRHRHLDDLITDLNRMVFSCKDDTLKFLTGTVIFALGTINDETGFMENYDNPEFILEFPVINDEVRE